MNGFKHFFTLLCIAGFSIHAMGQATGTLDGYIRSESSNETLPFASIQVYKDDLFVTGQAADENGHYHITGIETGTYLIQVSFLGYATLKVKDVTILPDRVVRRDFNLPDEQDEDGNSLTTVVVTDEKPIVEPGEFKPQGRDKEFIKNNPNRGVGDQAEGVAGVNKKDSGEDANFAGGRTDETVIIVDGIPLPPGASIGVTDNDIELMEFMLGGVPASLSDGTSFINIVTKGPANRFRGSIQAESSQYLDAFGANRLDWSFSGPILTKPVMLENGKVSKDEKGRPHRLSILGYRFSGTLSTSKDNRPSALGSYRLNDDALQNILDNPLTLTGNGSRVPTTNFLTEDDFEAIRVRENARNSSVILNGQLKWRASDDINVTLGGQYQNNWGNIANVGNRLLNTQWNAITRTSNWRLNGQFRHSFSSTKPTEKHQPTFQNFSYELQLSYNQQDAFSEDPRYQDNLFEYGYVGKFYRSLLPQVGIIDSNVIVNSAGDTIAYNPVFGHLGNQIVFDGYTPDATINPGLAAYNNHVDLDEVNNIEEMEIINGRFTGNRSDVFNLYNNAHFTQNTYGKSQSSQLRGAFKTNFDLVTGGGKKDKFRHKIELGGMYEQRIERSYNINPFELWTLADQSVNSHLENSTDITQATGEQFYDPITQRYYDEYLPLIRQDEDGNFVQMSQFGAEFREDQGLSQYDWVNVHELTPNDLKLEMFEPTTLIQGRQAVMGYYGYNYLGQALGTNVSFNDFFTATDENGRKTRPIAPNNPIYIAGYLQDKFVFKDIIVRAGVRFDSYDANTKVLKDPYSIAGYYTASEFEKSEYTQPQTTEYNRPDNIKEDYVVYVNENSIDATVVGYRNGEDWYNADGVQVNSPNVLGSNILPALRGFSSGQNDPQGEQYDPDLAFQDYKPTLIVLPRLSVSFPISKQAGFYAHYDVLSQRPNAATLATPLTYYNFRENVANGFISNPDLKPQRTINYEVGFEQALSEFSKLKMSMIYRESRDMIQVRQYIQAYPISYETFGNDDFSTYKAMSVEYELLRRLNRNPITKRWNPNLRILANYTLSFAEGTGSSPTSSANLAAEELKYIFALDFDQRHNFYLNMDYRFAEGKKYNGPKMKLGKKEVDILENTGLNMNFSLMSGSPYTQRLIPGGIGTSFGDRVTVGSINGARMPWLFRMDLKLDRDFIIGRKYDHPLYLNVYIRVQNVLNTQNVLNVYAATGSPTDDGFLTMANSPGIDLLNSFADSYSTLYNLRMNNPFNISRPRRIFIGASLNF